MAFNREANPEFTAWCDTLPEKHWARYDLSACRLGWEAAIAQRDERIKELGDALDRINDIMWESYMIEGQHANGKAIMEILEEYAAYGTGVPKEATQ